MCQIQAQAALRIEQWPFVVARLNLKVRDNFEQTDMNEKEETLKEWVSTKLSLPIKLDAIQGDASFRRYFRAYAPDQSWVAVHAPPEHEDNVAFAAMTQLLAKQGIPVPELVAVDYQQGFLLLSDLGDTLLLNQLTQENVDEWYSQVFEVLLQMQQCSSRALNGLPLFGANHIETELHYFNEWFLKKTLGIQLSSKEQSMLDDLYEQLIELCFIQPQVMIHRDFHSRNIMIEPTGQLGIIDYQDAMVGPITYDLVSLIKDCYIRWPKDKILAWGQLYHQRLNHVGLLDDTPLDTFYRWVDWTGLQRHLKVLGVFSRLKIRDQKSLYFKDTPRVMAYVLEVFDSYPEFELINALFKDKIQPPLMHLWRKEGIELAA